MTSPQAITEFPPRPAASDGSSPSDRAAASQPDQAATSITVDPLQMTAIELQAHAADIARVGDLILFDRSQAVGESRTWQCLRWMIRRTQTRILDDCGFDSKSVADGARFVHAAILGQAGRFGEMDGEARMRALGTVPPGTLLRFRRPISLDAKDASEVDGGSAWVVAMGDVRRQISYPTSELFMYYGWSWHINKIWLGRKFCNVFRSEDRDTCAAFAIGCWMRNGSTYFDQERSDAWYPGRVAVSCALRTICEVRILPPQTPPTTTTKGLLPCTVPL
jgi:hypothetical protein